MEKLGKILERFGYSADELKNPELYELHSFCKDCKRQRKFFNEYCPGVPAGDKYTLQACEAGKWIARQRWLRWLKENAS